MEVEGFACALPLGDHIDRYSARSPDVVEVDAGGHYGD
jgi:hypothetical protein